MMLRFILAALAASVASCGVAAWRWKHALPHAAPEAFSIPRAPRISESLSRVVAESESLLVANDMFRLPVDVVPITASGIVPAAAGHASQGRQSLVLKAIVGGPPWQAIVDGIPGQAAGTIVQAGATYGGITITTVGRDSVRVRAGDTTWTLYYRKGS